jgi:H+/Cl- antiporter ClcA
LPRAGAAGTPALAYIHAVSRRAVEFGCAVVVIGLLAGVAGGATTVVLRAVEHLTYHYLVGTLLVGVEGSGPWRRALGPMLGGALAGTGWWLLRRRAAVPKLTTVIDGRTPVPRVRLSVDALLQVVLVGSGASLGREGAPRQLAAALGDLGTSRWALTAADRRILLACAAGAGLGAVYSVPLGGAVFAVRIILGTWHPRALGAALITSSLAVAVAAPVTHLQHPLRWPDAAVSPLLAALALAVAPVAVAVGLAFDRVTRGGPLLRSWWIIPGIAAAGLLTGVCSIWFPELPGNGRSILEVSTDSTLTVASAAALLVLKPLLTAAFLRAGAVGGLLTPALATGAAAGSVLALALNTWAGTALPVSAISLTCAAGVLAITQRSPVFAALFTWELARPPLWLLAVFAVGAYAAYGLARWRRRGRPQAPHAEITEGV